MPREAVGFVANVSGKPWRRGFGFGAYKVVAAKAIDATRSYADEAVWLVVLKRRAAMPACPVG